MLCRSLDDHIVQYTASRLFSHGTAGNRRLDGRLSQSNDGRECDGGTHRPRERLERRE